MRLGYEYSLSIRIKELLDEGTLDEILNQVTEDIKAELFQTAPHDSATREMLYHETIAMQKISLRLKSIVNDLYMAERRD